MSTDKVLNFWKKNLGTVPGEVWNDTGITVLILAENALTALSTQIGQLQHLRTLDLGHNQLDRLPEELGKSEKQRRPNR
jgi:Leucine-rich repeat (LRR) protein